MKWNNVKWTRNILLSNKGITLKKYFSILPLIILILPLASCELTGLESDLYFIPMVDELTMESFWVIDYSKINNGETIQYLMDAILISSGEYCEVYVDLGQKYPDLARPGTKLNPFGTKDTYQTLLTVGETVKGIFDQYIYLTETQVFGEPLDIDNNGKVVILLYDILDGCTSDSCNAYIGGYFNPVDEIPENVAMQILEQHSNEREIFYMDIYPSRPDLSTSSFYYTLAHEFYHMLNYAHKVVNNPLNKGVIPLYYEKLWLNEGMAEVATDLVFSNPGYQPDRLFTFYLYKAFTRTLTWTRYSNNSEESLADYSVSYMYMRFLVDLLNDEDNNFLKLFHQNDQFGMDNINYCIGNTDTLPEIVDFEESYKYWVQAIYRLYEGETGNYAYSSIPVDDFELIMENQNYNFEENPSITGDIAPLAMKFYGFQNTTVNYQNEDENEIGAVFVDKIEGDPLFVYSDGNSSYDFTNKGIMATINLNQPMSYQQENQEVYAGEWNPQSEEITGIGGGGGASPLLSNPIPISGYPYLIDYPEVTIEE